MLAYGMASNEILRKAPGATSPKMRWQIIEESGHTYDCADNAAYRVAVNDESLAYPSDDATKRGLDWIDNGAVDCTCVDVKES